MELWSIYPPTALKPQAADSQRGVVEAEKPAQRGKAVLVSCTCLGAEDSWWALELASPTIHSARQGWNQLHTHCSASLNEIA